MSTTKEQRDELRRLWDNYQSPSHPSYRTATGEYELMRRVVVLLPLLIDEADVLSRIAAYINDTMTLPVDAGERWSLIRIREIIEGRDQQTETPK